MRPALYVRPLTEAERTSLEAGLRSRDAFVLRRCQILLASARRERVPQIAGALGCDEQTVRNVLHAFATKGLGVWARQSTRPRTLHRAIEAPEAEQLKSLLHQRPRRFGKPTSLWTLDLLAEVSFAEGITPYPVTGETIRMSLKRLGIRWQRAKHWITSPDPEYARKKEAVTA